MLHRFEAQAGVIHKRILRTFVWRHLRKFVGEFHCKVLATKRPQLKGGKLRPSWMVPMRRTARLDNFRPGGRVPLTVAFFDPTGNEIPQAAFRRWAGAYPVDHRVKQGLFS